MKYKIIAIPFAGGNTFSFKSMEKFLPSHFEWVTLELPGRGLRIKESFLDTIKDVIDDLFNQLRLHIKDGYYMIYGHSMGGLLGYEIIKKLTDEKMPLPCCLYATGRGAPSFIKKEKLADLPFDFFWEKVNEMGGLPKVVMESTEFLKFFYPILRSDFKLIESYEYQKLTKLLPIPIYVCLGMDEIGEDSAKVSINQVNAWNNETAHTVVPEFLKGDHFFIFEQPKAMIQKLSNAFETSLCEKIEF